MTNRKSLGHSLFQSCVGLEGSGRAWIDHDDLSAAGGEVRSFSREILHLPRADRALVAGPSAQNNQYDGLFGGELLQLHRLVFERVQGEVRGGVADDWRGCRWRGLKAKRKDDRYDQG